MTLKTLINLDDWQREILNYDGNILICTGRQNGKTTVMSYKIKKYMLEHPNSKIIVVSLTEDQAKLMIVMTLDALERDPETKNTIAKGKNKPTQNKIILKNGSQVIARPVGNTGDAIRGFTGDVLVIDECSRMPELAIEAGRPTLFTTSGQIWLCSTPFGKKGFFYESFLNKNNRFKVWHINSEWVAENRPISESWTEKQREGALRHLEEEKQSHSKTYYGQEYLALFMDDLQRFFEEELINNVCRLKPFEVTAGTRFLGVDIGRMYDPSAFEDVTLVLDQVFHVSSEITKEQRTDRTQDKIIAMDKAVRYRQIGIDAGSGSLGVGVYDNLLRSSVGYKLVAMNNRELSLDKSDKPKTQRLMKEDYYNNLKGMMERGEITLLDDENVKASLRSVQWEVTKEEDSTSKVKIFGNDTHRVEGLMRAAYLAKKQKVNKVFIDYI